MSPLALILIIVLLVVVLGGGYGYRTYGAVYPYYGPGMGIIGVVLVVLIVLLLMGRL
jgi:hypothetical protein